ncbi:hypothetical protein B0J13DRAFT_58040 [Dactylonectria estremocensis]|uniref:Uncharacterized protein n=1 Tax=Dactylonectria estremocensis TaxID=1079267 RepID=A0A9P9J445_9HYPO|nr:hypothetical protein B0J13DRAFT_58040 [Dactylonectria estremocensis]
MEPSAVLGDAFIGISMVPAKAGLLITETRTQPYQNEEDRSALQMRPWSHRKAISEQDRRPPVTTHGRQERSFRLTNGIVATSTEHSGASTRWPGSSWANERCRPAAPDMADARQLVDALIPHSQKELVPSNNVSHAAHSRTTSSTSDPVQENVPMGPCLNGHGRGEQSWTKEMETSLALLDPQDRHVTRDFARRVSLRRPIAEAKPLLT